MKHVTEYRNDKTVKALADKIRRAQIKRPITLMEVCGTHTMSIARFGLRQLLPANVRLISGPGCPVCVTPNETIDLAIAISRFPNVAVCTFGDMMRVPASSSSLELEHARGKDIRVVYSTLDALTFARKEPNKHFVFFGVGFETTTPTIAVAIQNAAAENLKNFSVISAHKTVPPALVAILAGPVKVDAFILPGHVSTIIGLDAYKDILSANKIAGSVAGFEPLDILLAIDDIVDQLANGKPDISNSYKRVVVGQGNPKAISIMNDVFEPCDAKWRGLGVIPASGLRIREKYCSFDASTCFDVSVEPVREEKNCRCGEILAGAITPSDCPLFGKACTPNSPVGACMVSAEGTCAAYYKYGDMR